MDLVDRLSAILGIVSANSPKPILGDFLLSAEAGNLTVEATDLEITGRIVVHKVEVARDGQLALPSVRLLAILKEISEDYVEIEALEDIPGAELNSSGFRFKILGHDPAEFPRAQTTEGAHSISLRRDRFHQSLRRVSVASSRDPTRFQLNGVFAEIVGGQIQFTATDGKRLTHDKFKLPEDAGIEVSAIIPNQAVDVLLKVLSSPLVNDEKILLEIAEKHISVKTEDAIVISTLIDGMYPNYHIVFPQGTKTRAKGKRSDLLTAARSASLTTDKQTSTVLFKISADGLLVESNAKNIGESHVHVPLELDGDPLDIRFNPVFFIEALRTFDEDDVLLEFTGSEKPVTLKGSQNYVHLVMPLVT